ncbi:hypothetical protein PG984_011077 [Apiospora sp. TS-2023a]
MAFPTENPRKVAIIVDHNMQNLRRLYAPLIKSLPNTEFDDQAFKSLDWISTEKNRIMPIHQDVKMCRERRAQDDGPIAHYPKRKRSSIYNDLSEDKLEGSLRSSADDGDERPASRATSVRKHGLGSNMSVLLGYWRDYPGPKPAGKHAVVGFMDVRDRLRTRIQNTTRNGDAINARLFPVPPGRDTNSVDHNMQNFRYLYAPLIGSLPKTEFGGPTCKSLDWTVPIRERRKAQGAVVRWRGTGGAHPGATPTFQQIDYKKLGRLMGYKNFRSAKSHMAKLRQRLYEATDLEDGENDTTKGMASAPVGASKCKASDNAGHVAPSEPEPRRREVAVDGGPEPHALGKGERCLSRGREPHLVLEKPGSQRTALLR